MKITQTLFFRSIEDTSDVKLNTLELVSLSTLYLRAKAFVHLMTLTTTRWLLEIIKNLMVDFIALISR